MSGPAARRRSTRQSCWRTSRCPRPRSHSSNGPTGPERAALPKTNFGRRLVSTALRAGRRSVGGLNHDRREDVEGAPARNRGRCSRHLRPGPASSSCARSPKGRASAWWCGRSPGVMPCATNTLLENPVSVATSNDVGQRTHAVARRVLGEQRDRLLSTGDLVAPGIHRSGA